MRIERNDWTGGPIRNYATRNTTSEYVIQLNCSEVHTHASYKTTRTWDKFNNHGTKIHYELLKMNYLLDELWLIANNSKWFANGGNSISNNLGLWKCFEIYQNWNIDLTRKDIQKKLMVFKSDRKSLQNYAVQRKKDHAWI